MDTSSAVCDIIAATFENGLPQVGGRRGRGASLMSLEKVRFTVTFPTSSKLN